MPSIEQPISKPYDRSRRSCATSGKPFDLLRYRKLSKSSLLFSYDLELDKKLAEETTVLSESYTVGAHTRKVSLAVIDSAYCLYSFQMDGRSELVLSDMRHLSACSSLVWSMLSSLVWRNFCSTPSKQHPWMYGPICTDTLCSVVVQACILVCRVD